MSVLMVSRLVHDSVHVRQPANNDAHSARQDFGCPKTSAPVPGPCAGYTSDAGLSLHRGKVYWHVSNAVRRGRHQGTRAACKHAALCTAPQRKKNFVCVQTTKARTLSLYARWASSSRRQACTVNQNAQNTSFNRLEMTAHHQTEPWRQERVQARSGSQQLKTLHPRK